MKETGLSRYYATTFTTWEDDAVKVYDQVNEPLKNVTGAIMVGHEILDNGVRKVTYDNGVTIYVNYSEEDFSSRRKNSSGIKLQIGGGLTK